MHAAYVKRLLWVELGLKLRERKRVQQCRDAEIHICKLTKTCEVCQLHPLHTMLHQVLFGRQVCTK